MSNQTFEQKHADIVKLIEDRNYCTSHYERRELGVLKEVWEKDESGEWQDITQTVLNEDALAKELAAAQRELKRLEAYLAKHNISIEGGEQ